MDESFRCGTLVGVNSGESSHGRVEHSAPAEDASTNPRDVLIGPHENHTGIVRLEVSERDSASYSLRDDRRNRPRPTDRRKPWT
jgi:hypothetical protein